MNDSLGEWVDATLAGTLNGSLVIGLSVGDVVGVKFLLLRDDTLGDIVGVAMFWETLVGDTVSDMVDEMFKDKVGDSVSSNS